jgi:trimethylamine--corrinoid protein Co-methyltransferase
MEFLAASDEIIGLIKRLMGGIEINTETLALDVIDRVGPGGQFLTEDHTYRHFKEDWYPTLFDRASYDSWRKKGQKPLGQRANERVRQILETHDLPPLPIEVENRLSKIIERAEKRASKEPV